MDGANGENTVQEGILSTAARDTSQWSGADGNNALFVCRSSTGMFSRLHELYVSVSDEDTDGFELHCPNPMKTSNVLAESIREEIDLCGTRDDVSIPWL